MAVHLLQAVGVELYLMLTPLGMDTCFLGFNNRQWIAVIVPKHIVRISDTGLGGLMRDFDLFLLGTPGLGACYTPGAVNNYQWVIPWMQCSRFTEDGFELPVAPMGEAMVWIAQTCVPVQ